jgi:hypothetical protein
MTQKLPNIRYEKKFVADGCTLAEVFATVHRHPAAFREVYPPRTINNIYWDSPTRSDYFEHLNGVANRVKTRVRWYGQRFEVAERPMLERKLKRGMVSGKETYELPPFSMNGGCLRALLESTFDNAVFPPVLRSILKHLEPALYNRYQRCYFLSGDRRFRLTVDSCLRFAGVTRNRQPAIDLLPPAPTVIMELKFEPKFAEDAARVTNAIPFSVGRFSKYVAGIECLRGLSASSSW